jgi:hypothetical protein
MLQDYTFMTSKYGMEKSLHHNEHKDVIQRTTNIYGRH